MTSGWKVKRPKNEKVIISAKVARADKLRLESLAKNYDLTVSAVAAQCIEYALKNVEI